MTTYNQDAINFAADQVEYRNQLQEVQVDLTKARKDLIKTEDTISRIEPNHILHIILSCLTVGLWLIIYAIVGMTSGLQMKGLKAKKSSLESRITDLEAEVQSLNNALRQPAPVQETPSASDSSRVRELELELEIAKLK
ncbi:MAG: hypothetical protein V3U78_00905 [Thiotrichaceae bacterium]